MFQYRRCHSPPKSDRDNIDDELAELRKQGRAWLELSAERTAAAIADEELQEVPYGKDEDGQE